MGNSLVCFSPSHKKPNSKTFNREPSKRSPSSSPFLSSIASTRRSKRSSKKKEMLADDSLLQQQAIEAVLLFQNHQKNASSIPLNRSTSVVYPSPGQQNQSFTKSSSSRQRLRSDAVSFQPLELVDKQDVKTDGLETNHFILVHGGGFGAWCWYKSMTLLEESGFKVDAVDLTGSGVDSFDTNSITSLAQYVKPLTDILEKLGDGKKDVALASVSMRPIPFATSDREALSFRHELRLCEAVLHSHSRRSCHKRSSTGDHDRIKPPGTSFSRLKGSDHAPFFSRPQALHRILVEISQIPPI
ncbi:putative methylesterase 11 chloroplastic [Prunus yedoensis var. nudiflora]|uniref:Putative methylesterase 11 chloroplastic n=1 Tax=Prunus yedoensis var. nudiflora TaxID=2094558 RepID=A0A314XI92_PRUYE|nr:putative methylesterase 11 chloroplastic [Prunus yedoensis var. nudiflora]